MPITINRKRKATPAVELAPESYLIRQLDQLQQISASYRDTFLGPDFYREARDFYNLAIGTGSRSPSFRPRIEIPQLQMFCVTEASDLADADPKIYITHDPLGIHKNAQQQKPSRDKIREKAFQIQW